MARTPDRRPGEADEEGLVLENRGPGQNPTIAGGIRYVNGAFSFRDSLGLFNPRSQLSAAGQETEIQYNYSGFLSASSDLRFVYGQRALVVPNISGSLTRLSDGSSFIIAGGNVSVITGSNGSITISTINSGTLSSLTAGTGLLGGGSSGAVSLSINDSVVATISGSTFAGAVKFNSGLSGSLTRLANGSPYILGTNTINVSTGSQGSITFTLANTGSAGTYGSLSSIPVFSTDAQGRVTQVTSTPIQISESQVTNLTASLQNRALNSILINPGNGLLGGGDLTTNRSLYIDDTVVATISGSTFSGAVKFNAGLSGSLTKLSTGEAYIVGGSSILVTTGSNGSITIDAVGGSQGGSLVDGYGTINYVARWQDTNTLTDGTIYDNGTTVGVGTVSGGDKFTVYGNTSFTGSVLPGIDAAYTLGSETKRWEAFLTSLKAYQVSQFFGNAEPSADVSHDLGTPSTRWRSLHAANVSGSLTGSGLDVGSVVFTGPGGLLTGSNSKLFWDNSNSRLGIGTAAPDDPLEIFGVSGSLFSVSDNLSGSLLSISGINGIPIFEVFSDNRVTAGGGYSSSGLVVTGTLVGFGTSLPAGRAHVYGTSTSSTPVLILQAGLASPTGKVLDARNSAGTTVASIDHLGNGSFSSNLTVSSKAGIGTAAGTDALSVFGTTSITGSVLPGTTNVYSLGSSSKVWSGIYANSFSGSLTRLLDGSSYIVAGAGISITTGSNGSITIINDGTVGDITSVNPGTGLTGGGSSGSVTLGINDSIVATVSGTTFTGAANFNAGLSGSLTRLTDGSSYLIAGSNLTITTGSNGSITIDSGMDGTAVIAGTDGQIQFNDGGNFGANSGLTYNKATQSLTGTYVVASSGFSGSLTQLTDGSSYLIAGTNINITTGSNGSITIEAALAPYTTASFTDVTSIIVNHSIGLSLYDIEVFDTNREKIIPKSAIATSPTRADITFSIPTSGYAIIGGPGALSAGGSFGISDLTNLSTNISTTGAITGSSASIGSGGITTTGQITGSAISLTDGSQALITPTTGSAPYYGSRAWVNFNGTGVVAIRASSNVSSITDVGVGSYRVNFSTPMPDTNYCALGLTQWSGGPYIVAHNSGYLTSSFALITGATAGSGADLSIVNVVVFR